VQRRAVRRSRSEPISLISGAPGTGKSHTVAAIACDALARGESVLVAAKSDATVDALLDLLERTPGPDPVVFGSTARREALAERLAAGQLQPLPDAEVGRAHEAHRQARANERATWQLLADQLGAEALVDAHEGGRTDGRDQVPGLFEPNTDLTAVEVLLDEVAAPTRGWLAGRRRRKRLRRLWAMAGCAPDTPPADLRVRLREVRAARAAFRLTAEGGLDVGGRWDELLALGDRARDETARWLAADCRSDRRLNRSTLPMVAALATALRSGRAARRDQLARIDGRLTEALPLWVGSLPDIDDLLPPVAGFFDLVILDEASSIDQAIAVPALLRARRGVVVGDPRQLRHVSFLADERLREVVAAHGLDQHPLLAARIDVRRNSVFDLAAGVSPRLTLDEHFRCHPHLVEFVADRLYGGAVKVATRAPSTTGKDCVTVVRVDGTRDRSGVVAAGVEWVVQELRRLRGSGAGSVGVITPFRAQADALEEAVLTSFTVDDLEALDLRVGTVHAFQGNERDVVIASLGVGPDQSANTWRFVEDPHLFGVLATRAREHLTVLVSAEPPERGLVADYLEQADTPPGPPAGAPSGDAWTAGIADDIRAAGNHVITSYPCGRHVLDVCVDDDGRDVVIECGVHPDGPDAHIERHLSLVRAGWDVLDAYPSRWAEHRGELVVELLHRIASSSSRI